MHSLRGGAAAVFAEALDEQLDGAEDALLFDVEDDAVGLELGAAEGAEELLRLLAFDAARHPENRALLVRLDARDAGFEAPHPQPHQRQQVPDLLRGIAE